MRVKICMQVHQKIRYERSRVLFGLDDVYVRLDSFKRSFQRPKKLFTHIAVQPEKCHYMIKFAPFFTVRFRI